MSPESDLWVMILAGGSGTRFWPASRRSRPKQLLPVLGEQPLLRRTVDRVAGLVGPERVLIVTGADQAEPTRACLPDLPEENILLEPAARNTAAACGLAAEWILGRSETGIMAVLPADHLIEPVAEFGRDLLAAAELAAAGPYLCTLGLKPTRPETGYGYLKQGGLLGEYGGRQGFILDSFKEKPDRATAERYIADGGYFWNAGIFIWAAGTIQARIRELMPELGEGLAELAPFLWGPDRTAALERIYPGLPANSIDFGVMEQAPDKVMIPASFEWSDVGSWETVHELSPRDERANALSGDVLCLDSTECLVQGREKMIALLGVENLVVVETEDALLIMDRDRAQDVGRIVKELKTKNRTELV